MWPRRNGRYNADDIFKCFFLKENVWMPTKFSLKFVRKGPINNIPALVQIMAWRRPGDKPLSEPMMVSLLTHICVTRSQWVNTDFLYCNMISYWVVSIWLVIIQKAPPLAFMYLSLEVLCEATPLCVANMDESVGFSDFQIRFREISLWVPRAFIRSNIILICVLYHRLKSGFTCPGGPGTYGAFQKRVWALRYQIKCTFLNVGVRYLVRNFKKYR